MRMLSLVVLCAALGACAVETSDDDDDDSDTTLALCEYQCAHYGQCTVLNDRCYASSDYECGQSTYCEQFGECYACPDGSCGTEAECGG